MGLIINADKVEKIYVHKAKKSHFIFYNAEPDKYTFFGLIRIEKAKKQRWWAWPGEFETREQLIENNENYFINYSEKYENSIWEKAKLYIVMSHSDNIQLHYNTDEEMNNTIDKIIEASKHNLIVIKD